MLAIDAVTNPRLPPPKRRRLRDYEAGLAGLIQDLLVPSEGPYISYSSAPDGWLLSDNSRPPAKKPFSKVLFLTWA